MIRESIFLATYRNPNDQVPALAADPEQFAEVFDNWGIAADAANGFVSERTGRTHPMDREPSSRNPA